MAIFCTRKFRFDAAHRVMNHENKCSNLHGHGYIAHVTAQGESLDELGRVIDFSVLKQKVGSWIDEHWDHNTILYEKDTKTIERIAEIQTTKTVFVTPYNPTVENLAKYLLHEVCPKVLKDDGVVVTKVRIEETVNCSAEVTVEL